MTDTYRIGGKTDDGGAGKLGLVSCGRRTANIIICQATPRRIHSAVSRKTCLCVCVCVCSFGRSHDPPAYRDLHYALYAHHSISHNLIVVDGSYIAGQKQTVEEKKHTDTHISHTLRKRVGIPQHRDACGGRRAGKRLMRREGESQSLTLKTRGIRIVE